MSDYLVVKEAEDGIWYDDGEVAISLPEARAVAARMNLPRGYDAVIYALRYVEVGKRAVETRDGTAGVTP
jgi:hypothetical protein